MSTTDHTGSEAGPPGGRDPRQIVTPYAFQVADELMGEPLATPWRRAAAMLVDLAAVLGVIILREITGPLFFVLLAWFAFRATTGRARHPVRRTLPRLALRAVAVILLLVGAGQGIELAVEGFGSSRDGSSASTGPPGAAVEEMAARRGMELGLGDLAGVMGRVGDLRSGDTARAREAAEQTARDLDAAGLTRAEIREMLAAVDRASADSTLRVAFRRALADFDSASSAAAPADTAGSARADSLAVAWASAVEAGDTAAADSARERLTGLLAADSVEALERRVSVLASTLDRMESRLEEAEEPPGPIAFLEAVARDLGLGLGWIGFYFTAFLALWSGHTPGKRLLGLRVAKVNGEPLGWWDSFSRFGGYAASIATGLVGFLQILWDANRQGLHDRIAGTVVLRERPGEDREEDGER